jgi:hypothetical protein
MSRFVRAVKWGNWPIAVKRRNYLSNVDIDAFVTAMAHEPTPFLICD